MLSIMDDDTIHLLIEHGHDRGTSVSIPADGAYVGRSATNDLAIHDPSLSRHHCRFYFVDGRLRVADLGSANGTVINGNRVIDSALRAGDVVALGQTEMKVVNDGVLTATLSSEEAQAADHTHMMPLHRSRFRVSRRWVPWWIRVPLWLLLAAWCLLLAYSLIPRSSPTRAPQPAVAPRVAAP
jgi:hypothetical protein